uniref:LAGLIDADG homing endonuclease n=1 Tax=Porodaedalea chrysoloma TaxID=74615 RepID=UPI0023AB13D1|nr:LAGLIDADG homing endonuclease [Porodaedalea chrysoloma]WCF76759.1 LAGLIDADG homing endonuclease [Porodaedalea chrysoloma]
MLPALNPTICWELFDLNFISRRQSAGNLLDLNVIGILRDYTLEFICCEILPCSFSLKGNEDIKTDHPSPKGAGRLFKFNNFDKINKNISNFNFSTYLTGLIEGDGSIIVPKTDRSIKGRINYPSIQIVFHLKDLPLALMIQKNLKHGSLSRKKGVNAYVLTINNYEGLLLTSSLINGHMRTPKIYALWDLIDWLNLRFKDIHLNKKPLDANLLESNAWLSGFIEADGHFSIRTTTISKYPKVECKFELSQRKIDHRGRDNLYFLEIIAKFLLSSVKSIRNNRPCSEYRVRTTSLKGNLILENYLESYPLFGSKYLDYKDWIKVLDYFKSGSFKVKNDTRWVGYIISIKSNMNDRRTVFTWDQLNKFYNLDK